MAPSSALVVQIEVIKNVFPAFEGPVQRDSEAVARATDSGSVAQICRYQFNG